MIRLGLRLCLAGSREATARLLVIVVAVAVGVGLLLTALAGINAVDAQNGRYVWLSTGAAAARPPIAGTQPADPLWWLLRADYFQGETIGRVDVAATGPRSPVPPGIPDLPGPGQFYASPALSELLRSTPADELADRFPGRQVGTIGPSALPGPDALVIIVGQPADALARLPGAVQVSSIMTNGPCDDCGLGVRAAGMNLLLSVVAAALLFPVLIFISTATRLAAARREQRFAAMRLVGATPRQVSALAAVESTVAALAGTVVGFGVFLLFRPAVADIPFTGARFYPADLALDAGDVLLVAIGIPLSAVAAARLALRRVHISPLGVSRRVTPSAPRAWRLVPLAVGIGELAYFVGRRPSTADGQTAAYLTGILLVMVGLLVAGPWLTMLGSRVLARLATGPATLIAARRLADNPQAGFRAVSGLMLALFVTAVATGVITTIVANRGAPRSGAMFSDTLSATFWPEERPGEPPVTVDAVPAAALRSIPGVQQVTVVHLNPAGRPAPGTDPGWRPGVVACADLARHRGSGGCAPGAQAAVVDSDLVGARSVRSTEEPGVWPTAPIAVDRLSQLPVLSLVVGTDGSAPAIERARTALERAFPAVRFLPSTVGEFEGDFRRTLVQWQQLANVVILATLPIAGCSLAVSVAGGLSDRKRPFSRLRLTGAQLGVLRRVVALETAVPLLVVAAMATGTGLLAAHLFLTSQLEYALQPPGAGYYLTVGAGLAVCLGIIASTLPLLSRITGPETARNEG